MDSVTEPRIRPYHQADLAAVYDICVKTGPSGADAKGRFHDDDLLPDIYVGPYVKLEPESAWVVIARGRVAGYIIATANTRSFVERYRESWLPSFATKYPLVDPPITWNDRLVKIGHTPDSMIGPNIDDYPAHLHIDLLPEIQGMGMGRRLVRTLLVALNGRGVRGVQLGVGESNLGARAFYKRLGFRPLPADPENETCLGIRTDAIV